MRAKHLTPNGWKPCESTTRKCKYASATVSNTIQAQALDVKHPLISFYNSQYERNASKWQQEHLDAIHRFTGLGYLPIRRFLLNREEWDAKTRKNFSPEEVEQKTNEMNKFVSLLDEATSKPHNIPAPVYRVILPENETSKTGEEWCKELNYVEGETVSFGTFSSTSVDPRIVNVYLRDEDEEEQAIVFRIVSKTGAIVSKTSQTETVNYTQDSEREIILPRDKQYKIVKVSRNTVYMPRKDDENWLEPSRPLTVDLIEI